jgi:nucleoside-diphosphate-sugar epimerase
MKILVSGSSGQLGSAIIDLLEKKYEVIGLDVIAGPKTSLVGSINDWQLLKSIGKNLQAIIHPASLHAPHVKQFDRAKFVEVNVQGTLHLLELAKLYQIPQFIYTSTTSIYGQALANPQEAVWVSENLHPQPRDIYDITKLAAEQLCEDFYRSEGLRAACLRVGRFWDEPLADKVFYRLYRGLDVRDAAQAHLLALENQTIGFEVFNIAAQSIFDESETKALKTNALEIISQKIPHLIQYFQEQNWPISHSIDRVYAIEKAKKILGYTPQFNIQAMLEELGFNK